jgi:histidinol-phosphate aminotransferase
VTESQANFSWVAVDDEEAVLKGLEEQGVIVRGGAALGDPGHLRVTYGTRTENDAFLAALDGVVQNA